MIPQPSLSPEALAEAERLEVACTCNADDYEGQHDQGCSVALVASALDAKNREINRKNTALGQIANLGERGMKPDYSDWLTFHEKVAQIARSALMDNGRKE